MLSLIKKFRDTIYLFKTNNDMNNLQKAGRYTSLGNRYGNERKLSEAIKSFKRAIRIKSDYAPAYLGLAIAYREKGLLSKALKLLENMPTKMKFCNKLIGGIDYDKYAIMATVYILKNDKQRARECAKKALIAFDDPKRKEQKNWAKEVATYYPESVEKSIWSEAIKYELNKDENEEKKLLESLIEEFDEGKAC